MRSNLTPSGAVLKAATVQSVNAAGGVCEASKLLGVGSSTLSKYCSTSEEWRRNFIRVDLAVALDSATAHPFLLTAMSGLVRDRRTASSGLVTAAAILKLNGVLDDVVREVSSAIENDGRIDAGERLAIRGRIVAGMQKLAWLDAMVADR